MPLLEATISIDVKIVYDNAESDSIAGDTPAMVKQASADDLATAIANAIKSLRITIPPGAIVVTGTAATQSNPNPIILDSVIS